MNLQMFREKLMYEINRVEEFSPFGMFAIDRVQVHLYCVSTILKKILEVIPDYGSNNINSSVLYKVGGGEDIDITLEKIIDVIRHHIEFRIGFKTHDHSVIENLDIMSDKDYKYQGLYLRNISLEEFLNISKEIGENDRKILKPLVSNTIKILKSDMQFDDGIEERDKLFGNKTVKSIEYLFNLVRKIDNYNLPEGFITFFKVDWSGSIVDGGCRNVGYLDIFKHLQLDWFLHTGKDYIKTHTNISDTRLKNEKTVSVWNLHDELILDKKCQYIILVEDLLNMIDEI